MAADSPIKARLLEAHAAHLAALTELEAATRAVDQGRGLVAEREADLAQLEAEDLGAALEVAGRILDAARVGAGHVGITEGQAAAKIAAEHRLRIAADTLKALLTNKDKADREADRTYVEAKIAVTARLNEGADLLAGELRASVERVNILRSTLLGLGMVRVEPDKPFPLSRAVREAIAVAEAQPMPGQEIVRLAQQSWRAQFDGLMQDPETDLSLFLPANRVH